MNLFNYPVVVQHAPHLCYGGHSSHVMNVRWGADESYVVSVGGRDRAVFQWRVTRERPVVPPPLLQPWAPTDQSGLHWAPPSHSHYQPTQPTPLAQPPQGGRPGVGRGGGVPAAAGAGRPAAAGGGRGAGLEAVGGAGRQAVAGVRRIQSGR